MEEFGDFVIENGVLTKYIGPGGDVIIPDGVTEIGKGAFIGSNSVTSVVFSDTVTTIGPIAFGFCVKLKSINLSLSIHSIEDQAFSNCTSLTNIVVPSSVLRIGNSVFECSGLQEAIIEAPLTILPSAIFCACKSLTSVTLPNTIVEIGRSAFRRCESLKEFVLPERIVNIGPTAFEGCEGLTSFVVESSEASSPRKASWGEGIFKNCSTLESIALPSSLTVIPAGAFEGCKRLMTVVFPNALEEIDFNAFKDCTSLASVSLPASLCRIKEYAFMGCTNLVEAQLNDSVEIDVGAFADCPLKKCNRQLKPEQLFSVDAFLLKMNQETRQFEWADSYYNIFNKKSVTFHFETNEKLQDKLLSFLKSETAEITFAPNCASSVILNQSKKWAEAAINAHYGTEASIVVQLMIDSLDPLEKVPKAIGDRTLSFVSEHKDTVSKDIITILYEFLKRKKCTTFKSFSLVLGENWNQ